MSTPYVGEIRMVGLNYAPAGWALCNGQLLSINNYQTLFTLIGTTYGGDGQNTFALPNLQSRVAIHQGSNGFSDYPLAQDAGVESVTLTLTEIPTHLHVMNASAALGNSASPSGALLAEGSYEGHNTNNYTTGSGGSTLGASAIGNAGGSQPHSNIQPYLVVNFIIALFGVFPTQG